MKKRLHMELHLLRESWLQKNDSFQVTVVQ